MHHPLYHNLNEILLRKKCCQNAFSNGKIYIWTKITTEGLPGKCKHKERFLQVIARFFWMHNCSLSEIFNFFFYFFTFFSWLIYLFPSHYSNRYFEDKKKKNHTISHLRQVSYWTFPMKREDLLKNSVILMPASMHQYDF